MPLARPPENGRAVADAVYDAMIATLNAPREDLLTMSRYLQGVLEGSRLHIALYIETLKEDGRLHGEFVSSP